jgi:hypothetical protein
VVLAALALSLCVPLPKARAEEPSRGLDDYVWLDVDGQPLPFQDHTEIREAMRAATVISREPTDRGIAEVEKIELEVGGTRFHAAFRHVDVSKRAAPTLGARRRGEEYRDAAIFESAAYELSELLGIGRVPPVVVRKVGEKDGTVQIWMEEVTPEVVLVEEDRYEPPDALRFVQQKQIMSVFDNLISNRDRNQGNLLIDRDWNLWLIDHTRAFTRSSSLLSKDKLVMCERRLWASLQEVDEETIRLRLEPFLERTEISNLLRRRTKLIRHFEKLITKRGEAAVLYDVKPPAAAAADRSQ